MLTYNESLLRGKAENKEAVEPWHPSESQASCFNFPFLVADGSFAGVLNLLITNRVLFFQMLRIFPQEQTMKSHCNMAQPNSQEAMM